MTQCRNRRCRRYNERFLYHCRIGDLFCLMIQEADREAPNKKAALYGCASKRPEREMERKARS